MARPLLLHSGSEGMRSLTVIESGFLYRPAGRFCGLRLSPKHQPVSRDRPEGAVL